MNSENRTALYRSARNGEIRVVEELLRRGANPALGPQDWAPYEKDEGVRRCQEVVTRAQAVERERGRAQGIEQLTVALFVACEAGEAGKVADCLAQGANVNAADNASGGTALHAASRSGSVASVTHLLGAQADPNARDDLGMTALHHAAKFGRPEVVKALLLYGAEARILDAAGWSPLHWAAWNGHPDLMQPLLAAGCGPNEVDVSGSVPLVHPVFFGFAETARLLIAGGARANVADKTGKSLLMWAADMGNDEMVNDLALAGADLNAADENGMSAIHYAGRAGHIGSMWVCMNLGCYIGKGDLVLARNQGWPAPSIDALKHGLRLRQPKCQIS